MPLGFSDLGNIVTPFKLTPYSSTGEMGNLYRSKQEERLKKAELAEAAARRQAERDAEHEAEMGRMDRARMDSADRAAQERRLASQFLSEQGRKDQEDLNALRENYAKALAQGDPAAVRVTGELLRRHKLVGRLDEPTAPQSSSGSGGSTGTAEPKATAKPVEKAAPPPKQQETGAEVSGQSQTLSPEDRAAMSPEDLATWDAMQAEQSNVDFGAQGGDTKIPEWVLPGRENEYLKDPQGEEALFQEVRQELLAKGVPEEEIISRIRSSHGIEQGDPRVTGAGPEAKNDLEIGEQLREKRRIELGLGSPKGLGSGGGLGEDPLGLNGAPLEPTNAPDALPEGWQAEAASRLGVGGIGGGLGSDQGLPESGGKSGLYTAYGKTGEVLFQVNADEIRKKQEEAVRGAFGPLENKPAADRAMQSVLGEIGQKPLGVLIEDGMKRYEFEVGQEGKDRRALVSGPIGPSLAERRFQNTITGDESAEAWRAINYYKQTESIQKNKEALRLAGNISSMASADSGYQNLSALKAQIVMLEKRATDADLRVALEAGGLMNRITSAANYVLREGQKDPEYMKEVRQVALLAQQAILKQLKDAGEGAYNSVLNSPVIDPSRRQRVAAWAYGTVTGDFGRMPKDEQPGQGGGASEQGNRERYGF